MTNPAETPKAPTPTPYRLWRGTEPEAYPEPHDRDRRLVGANNICLGILFGMLDEVEAAQDFIVLACNSHARLTRERDELKAALRANELAVDGLAAQGFKQRADTQAVLDRIKTTCRSTLQSLKQGEG